MQDALLRYGVFCCAYVLMSDQVQLLLSCGCREGVAQVMAVAGDRHYWSKEFDGVAQDPTGRDRMTLRYFCRRIRNDRHLRAAQRYIERKPERSGLVAHSR